jgi:hypothetical protein
MERTGGEPDVVGHDNEAKFLDPVQRHAWRRWKFDWLTPKKRGQYTLLARAKDAKGGVQPDKHDLNYDTYVILMAYDEQQSELSCREDQQRKQKAESIDGGYLLLKQPQQPAFRRPLAQLYPADTSRGCFDTLKSPLG